MCVCGCGRVCQDCMTHTHSVPWPAHLALQAKHAIAIYSTRSILTALMVPAPRVVCAPVCCCVSVLHHVGVDVLRLEAAGSNVPVVLVDVLHL